MAKFSPNPVSFGKAFDDFTVFTRRFKEDELRKNLKRPNVEFLLGASGGCKRNTKTTDFEVLAG
jgi:hypothetical protein